MVNKGKVTGISNAYVFICKVNGHLEEDKKRLKSQGSQILFGQKYYSRMYDETLQRQKDNYLLPTHQIRKHKFP